MNNKLPQKYKEGLFIKIKRYFRNLFGKKNIDLDENVDTKSEVNVEEKSSIEIMKEETHRIIDQENLLKQIEDNPYVIMDWPMERLLKLEKVCDEKILQYHKEIKVLEGKTA